MQGHLVLVSVLLEHIQLVQQWTALTALLVHIVLVTKVHAYLYPPVICYNPGSITIKYFHFYFQDATVTFAQLVPVHLFAQEEPILEAPQLLALIAQEDNTAPLAYQLAHQ